MAIATADMKHGMRVTFDGKEWDVLDRHPLSGNWWLHRWEGERWETDYAHEHSMDAADAASLSAPIAESDKWKQAAFNIADGTTEPAAAKRKSGYVLGKWAAHKREDTRWHAWTITHLPTGLSVTQAQNLQETRGIIEQLAGQEFPELDSAPFGVKPAAGPDIARLKDLLQTASA